MYSCTRCGCYGDVQIQLFHETESHFVGIKSAPDRLINLSGVQRIDYTASDLNLKSQSVHSSRLNDESVGAPHAREVTAVM